MKPITVLVTGIGSTIGIGIAKALRACQLPVRIVGVDCEPLSMGLFRVDQAYVVPSARVDKLPYFEALIQISQAERVQILLSGWEGELPLLSDHKTEFEQRTGAIVPLAPEGIRLAIDKWLTFTVLSRAGVPVPDTALISDLDQLERFRSQHSYPYILKPRCGSGSRGVMLIQTDEEFQYFSQTLHQPIVQERLLPEDQEYTVGLFLQQDGQCVASLALKRSLMAGLSYRMESVQQETVCQVAVQAAQAIGIRGAANVQLRLTPTGAKVFEVNPRFSSASCVRAHFGLNEPELAIRHFVLGETLSNGLVPPTTKTGVCLRFWEEMYLPADAKISAQQGQFPYRGEILSQF